VVIQLMNKELLIISNSTMVKKSLESNAIMLSTFKGLSFVLKC
jgi:hypothetical protein